MFGASADKSRSIGCKQVGLRARVSRVQVLGIRQGVR